MATYNVVPCTIQAIQDLRVSQSRQPITPLPQTWPIVSAICKIDTAWDFRGDGMRPNYGYMYLCEAISAVEGDQCYGK